jgi:hypothetical protein
LKNKRYILVAFIFTLLPVNNVFFRNSPLATRSFQRKVRVDVRVAGLWKRIQRMGAVAPIPPRARSSAAPDGAPPRRIHEREPHLPSEGPMRRPSDSERKRGGGGIVNAFQYIQIVVLVRMRLINRASGWWCVVVGQNLARLSESFLKMDRRDISE